MRTGRQAGTRVGRRRREKQPRRAQELEPQKPEKMEGRGKLNGGRMEGSLTSHPSGERPLPCPPNSSHHRLAPTDPDCLSARPPAPAHQPARAIATCISSLVRLRLPRRPRSGCQHLPSAPSAARSSQAWQPSAGSEPRTLPRMRPGQPQQAQRPPLPAQRCVVRTARGHRTGRSRASPSSAACAGSSPSAPTLATDAAF